MRRFLPLLLSALLPVSALAFPHMAPDSGVKMEITPAFGEQEGNLMPFRVTVWNHSKRPGSWQLTRRSTGRDVSFRDTAAFQVPAGETRTFELILQGTSKNGRNELSLVGTHLDGEHTNTSSLHGRPSPLFTASTSLEIPLLAPYRDHISKLKNWELNNFSTFDPSNLIADWRAFSSANRLIFSQQDWREALSPEVRNSIRQWVAMGGKLYIAAPPDDTPLWPGLALNPQGGTAEHPYGSGTVAWLDLADISQTLNLLKSVKASTHALTPPSSPPLRDATTFIFIFTVGLASIIGPVNVLYLAPASRRHRLFWTTPAIALASTALLAAFILLKDGVGGSGERRVVIRLLPGNHEAAVSQTQASSTGVLFRRNFSFSEPSGYLLSNSPRGSYQRSATDYSGNWFQVRAQMQHRLHALRSTRMSVTLHPSAIAPEVISTIEIPLTQLVICDQEGKHWVAHNVRAGERAQLQPLENLTKLAWLNVAAQAPDISERPALKGILEADSRLRPGHFIAQLSDATPFAMPTHRAIRWSDTGIVAGPLLTPSAP